MSDMSVARATATVGPWTRSERSTRDESPPHKCIDSLPWHDPVNQFGIEYADEARTFPVAALDFDGCRALILEVQPDATEEAGR